MAVTKDDTTQGAVPPEPKAPPTAPPPWAVDRPPTPSYQPPPASATGGGGTVGSTAGIVPLITPGMTQIGAPQESKATTLAPLRVAAQIQTQANQNVYGISSDQANSAYTFGERANLLGTDRGGGLEFLREAPFTALALITSPVPNAVLRAIGQNIGTTWRFLHESDPNLLTARAIAMGMPPGVVRSEVMDFLDQRGVITAPGISEQGAAADVLFRGEAHEIDRGPLFFRVWNAAKLPFDIAGMLFGAAAGIALHNVVGRPMDKLAALAYTLHIPGAEAAQNWIHDQLSVDQLSEDVGLTFGRLTDLIAGGTLAIDGELFSALSGGALGSANVDWWKYAWPENPGTGFGLAMADFSAHHGLVQEGDYGYQTIEGVSSFVAQWAVTAGIGKFAAGLKEGVRVPDIDRPVYPGLDATPADMAKFNADVAAYKEFIKARTDRLGFLGEIGYELRAKGWDAWLASNRGTKYATWVKDMLDRGGDLAGGNLQLRWPTEQMPPTLARNLDLLRQRGGYTVDDIKLVTSEHAHGRIDSLSYAADRGTEGALVASLADGTETPIALSHGDMVWNGTSWAPAPRPALVGPARYDALSKLHQVQDRLAKPSSYAPMDLIFKFPRKNTARSLYYNLGEHGWAAPIRHLLNPEHRWIPHVVRFFDSHSNAIRLNDGDFSANARTIRSLYDRVGVSPAETARVLDRMSKTHPGDSAAWNDLAADIVTTPMDGPMLKGKLDAHMEDSLFRYAGEIKNIASRHRQLNEIWVGADGKGTVAFADVLSRRSPMRDLDGNIMRDYNGQPRYTEAPLPAMESEFLGQTINLPNFDEWAAATSWWRSFRKEMRRKNPYSREYVHSGARDTMVRVGAVLPFDGIQAVSTGMTMLLKPAVLTAFGLRIPALAMRIIGEEVVRGGLYGYGFHPINYFRGDYAPFDFEIPRGKFGTAINRYVERRRWTSDKAAARAWLEEQNALSLEAGEQALSTSAIDRLSNAAARELRDLRMKEEMPDLGSVMWNDEWGAHGADYQVVNVFGDVDRRTGRPTLTDEGLEGIWQRMMSANGSFSAHVLARRGPEGFVRWMREDPVGQQFLEQMTPNLRTHIAGRVGEEGIPVADVTGPMIDAFLPEYARARYDAMRTMFPQEVVDGIPLRRVNYRRKTVQERVETELATTQIKRPIGETRKPFEEMTPAERAYEANRKWKQERPIPRPYAEEYTAEYGKLIEQDGLINGSIRKAWERNATPEEFQALYELARDTRQRLREIEKMAKIRPRETYFPFENKDAIKALLKDMYDDGVWTPPTYVSVKKDIGLGYKDASRGHLTAVNRYLYDSTLGLPFGGMRAVTALDIRFARGRLYKQAAREQVAYARGLGWGEKSAEQLGRARAAFLVRDMLYDLSESSSMARFLKNVFWFAPAYQELLATWFLKIPSRFYWPVGVATLWERGKLITDTAKQLGWIKEDDQGNPVTVLPWFGRFLDNVWPEGPGGALVKDIVSFNPANLNFIGTGPDWHGIPLPGLSQQYNVLLAQWARGDLPGVRTKGMNFARAIAEVLQPYGQDVRLGPPALNLAWTFAVAGMAPDDPKAAFKFMQDHAVPPWELFARGYVETQFDLGAEDAMRQARVIVGAAPDSEAISTYRNEAGQTVTGYLYPHDELGKLTPGGEASYKSDYEAWQDDVLRETKSLMLGTGFIRLVGATLFPTQLRVTTDYQQDANALYDELAGKKPADYDENPDSPAAMRYRSLRDKLYNEWIADHPGGNFYLIAKSDVTGQQVGTLPYTVSDEDPFYEQIRAGLREANTPLEYLAKAAGWESYRFYTGQRAAALAEAGAVDGPTALLAGFDTKQANLQFQQSWQNYLTLNPEFDLMFKQQRDAWVAEGVSPDQTMTTEFLWQAKQDLNALAPLFTVDGIRGSDFKTVLAKVNERFSEGFVPGVAKDPMAAGVSWYWNTVLDPMFEELNPLFTQADAMSAAGEDASAVWEKIRNVYNKWDSKTLMGPDGLRYPSPSEALFSNRSPEEQHLATVKWASKPISWLNGFQRDTVGYNIPPRADEFFFARDTRMDAFYAFVKDPNNNPSNKGRPRSEWTAMSPNSKAYEAAVADRDADIARIAAGFGPQYADLNKLDTSPPAVRIIMSKVSIGVPGYQTFLRAASMASDAYDAIVEAGFSPRADGNTAVAQKAPVFAFIADMRNKDPHFDDFMADLGTAVPLAGKDTREGVPLYQAIFFGMFNTAYMDRDLIEQYGPKYGGGGSSSGAAPGAPPWSGATGANPQYAAPTTNGSSGSSGGGPAPPPWAPGG